MTESLLCCSRCLFDAISITQDECVYTSEYFTEYSPRLFNVKIFRVEVG